MADELSFDEAVDRWCDASRGTADLSEKELTTIQTGLRAYIGGAFYVLDLDEIADIVDETITRMVEAIQASRVDQGRNPRGYLITIARHEAISRLRRSGHVSVVETGNAEISLSIDPLTVLSDDQVAALVDREANAEVIRRGLEVAAQNRDWIVTKVVATWLNIASTEGRAPSMREVARAANVTHPTVASALRRFMKYLSTPMQ